MTIAWSLLPLPAAPIQLQHLLPDYAKVIETAAVDTRMPGGRTLVLWMLRPKKVLRQGVMGCSDDVYGNHWYGPTRLSVLDTGKMTLINTIAVQGSVETEHDFSIPFFVSNYFYDVPKPNRKREGVPRILSLKDLTGEGVAGQFVLSDYEACGIALTSVFGYSPRIDAAVQYRVELVQSGEKRQTLSWIPHTFGEKATRPGEWSFTWEPGHGADAWIHEEVAFEAPRQIFVDRMSVRPYSEAALPRPTPKERKH